MGSFGKSWKLNSNARPRFCARIIIFQTCVGGVVGPAQPEAEVALVRVAQGRDFPGAVVAAQRDYPGQQWHRSQV